MPARRRWLTRTFLGAAVLLGIASALYLPHAWREAKRQAASLPELEAEAARAPGDDRLQVRVALRRLQAGEYDRATESLRHAADAGSRDGDVWRFWAANVAAVGERAEVEAILKRADADPALAPQVRDAAAAFRALPEAATGEEKMRALSPDGADVLARRYDGGSFLSVWLKRPPALAPVARAQALLDDRRYDEAEESLRAVLEQDRGNLDAFLALAAVRERRGRWEEALGMYRAGLNHDADNVPALLGAGRCATALKLYFVGMEYGQRAVARAPKFADAWIVLGQAYGNQKMRWDKAAEAFETARRLDPARLETYAYLSYFDTLKALGRFDEAEALVRRRLKQDPDDGRAHALLASALLDRPADVAAATREAEAHLRTALRLQPGFVGAQVRLGQLLLDRNEPEEAAYWLAKARAQDRYHPQATALLARALARRGDAAGAQAMRTEALQVSAYLRERTPLEDIRAREPTNLPVLRRLAALYQRGGETEKAEKARRNITALENRQAP